MVKKIKKEPEKKKPKKLDKEPTPGGICVKGGIATPKEMELAGQIEDMRTCLRICQQYDIHRTSGAQTLLEKLENELESYK